MARGRARQREAEGERQKHDSEPGWGSVEASRARESTLEREVLRARWVGAGPTTKARGRARQRDAEGERQKHDSEPGWGSVEASRARESTLEREVLRARWVGAGPTTKARCRACQREAEGGPKESVLASRGWGPGEDKKMCGIIGYIGTKDVVPVLIDGLRRLEYRGYDSAGVAVVHSGNVNLRRSAGKLSNLEHAISAEPLAGEYGVGHTRWATHGRPTEENAHPHQDGSGKIVVVHNGIIENYLPLKARLQAAGHAFVTQTDTEIVAHLVASHYTGDLEEA